MSRKEDFKKASQSLEIQVISNPWTLFEKGCEYGYQYALQHPHWIPVEERLPEETEVVLGVREGGTDVEMYKFMGFNESTNTFDWEWHPYYRAVVDDVTHWMPLPAAPQGKEAKNEKDFSDTGYACRTAGKL